MNEDIRPFKIDKNGLYYIDNESLLTPFSFNELVIPQSFRRTFYKIEGNDNYIVKDNSQRPLLFNELRNKKMLLRLNKKQVYCPDIDFPIGYFLHNNKITGTIIPFYQDALSLRKLFYLHDMGELDKYYKHDDNYYMNITFLCLDILKLIEELVSQKIFYSDIHSGNFLLYNNEVKIIDFDPEFIHFDKKKDWYYKEVLRNFGFLIHAIWVKLGYYNVSFDLGEDFLDAKEKIKSIGNHYRRG